MKIYLNKQGVVTARAESMADVQTLMSLNGKVEAEKKNGHKPYSRRCHQCGKQFHGRMGIAIHKTRMHKEVLAA